MLADLEYAFSLFLFVSHGKILPPGFTRYREFQYRFVESETCPTERGRLTPLRTIHSWPFILPHCQRQALGKKDHAVNAGNRRDLPEEPIVHAHVVSSKTGIAPMAPVWVSSVPKVRETCAEALLSHQTTSTTITVMSSCCVADVGCH